MPDKSSARLSLGEQGRLLPVHPSATMTNRCSLIYLRIEIMHSYSKTAVRFVDRGHSSLESRSKFRAEEVASGKSDLTCENIFHSAETGKALVLSAGRRGNTYKHSEGFALMTWGNEFFYWRG